MVASEYGRLARNGKGLYVCSAYVLIDSLVHIYSSISVSCLIMHDCTFSDKSLFSVFFVVNLDFLLLNSLWIIFSIHINLLNFWGEMELRVCG